MYTCSRFFVQYVVGKHIMALFKYFKWEVKTALPSLTGSSSKAITSGEIVAVNKEVQRVMDTYNDRTLLKEGPIWAFWWQGKSANCRYAADHRVSTHNIVPPFFKNKSHGTEAHVQW